MRIILLVYLLLASFFTLMGCSEEEVNLDTVDSLLIVGEYDRAGEMLHNYEMRSYSDTVQVKRINARIRTLKRKRFFKSPDKYISAKEWQKAFYALDSLQSRINRMPKDDKEPYLFDYFYRKAVIDSALGENEKSITDMEQAVEYYTSEHEKLWRLYENLAFYYARQGEYDKARENLDKALRKTDYNKIDSRLQNVFTLYMNGRFLKARDSLRAAPDSVKDKHWRTAQLFFEKYADKLTMKERFRLW